MNFLIAAIGHHIAVYIMILALSHTRCHIYFNSTIFFRGIPYGLVVRIRRSHRRGPGSIPGVGTQTFLFLQIVFCHLISALELRFPEHLKNLLCSKH